MIKGLNEDEIMLHQTTNSSNPIAARLIKEKEETKA